MPDRVKSISGTYGSERVIFVKCLFIFCVHSQGTLVSDAFKQSEDWHIEQVFNILLGLLLCILNSLKCHYDQILDIHFFIFSDTVGLS